MKKSIWVVMITFIILSVFASTVLASQPIKVFVEGKPVVFDVQPVLEGGRVLVPVRAIFEVLGAAVEWDGKTGTVYAEKDDFYVEFSVNDQQADINGYKEDMDVPARIINKRVLVPLRFAGEAFNAVVKWDSKTFTVNIDYKKPASFGLSQPERIGSTEYDEKFYPDFFDLLPDGSFLLQGTEIAYDEVVEAYYAKYLVIYFYDAKTGEVDKIIHEDMDTARYMGWFTHVLPGGRLMVERYIEMEDTVRTVLFNFDPRTGKLTEALKVPDNDSSHISFRGDIVYQLDEGDQADLYLLRLNGETVKLTDTPNVSETLPWWSPNGKKIAVISIPVDTQKKQYISVINADGTGRVDLSYPVEYLTSLEWSPDSEMLTYKKEEYFTGNENTNGIWVVNADGTSGAFVPGTRDMINPNWSPSNNLFAWEYREASAGYRVVMLKKDGTVLARTGRTRGNPAWSSDGQIMAYNSYGEIWLLQPEGDRASRMFSGDADIISWTKSGDEVYFILGNRVWKSRLVSVAFE